MNNKDKQSVEKINKNECDNLSYEGFGSWTEWSINSIEESDHDESND